MTKQMRKGTSSRRIFFLSPFFLRVLVRLTRTGIITLFLPTSPHQKGNEPRRCSFHHDESYLHVSILWGSKQRARW